jgi:alkylation response protein AidB-like acyl-CoA dehydrogenase
LSAHTSLCTWPILHLGNEEQKQRFLPRMASGESLGALGLTEPMAGSDVGATMMTAVRDGDEYILNGTKIFITNGYYADILCSAGNEPAIRMPSMGTAVILSLRRVLRVSLSAKRKRRWAFVPRLPTSWFRKLPGPQGKPVGE